MPSGHPHGQPQGAVELHGWVDVAGGPQRVVDISAVKGAVEDPQQVIATEGRSRHPRRITGTRRLHLGKFDRAFLPLRRHRG